MKEILLVKQQNISWGAGGTNTECGFSINSLPYFALFFKALGWICKDQATISPNLSAPNNELSWSPAIIMQGYNVGPWNKDSLLVYMVKTWNIKAYLNITKPLGLITLLNLSHTKKKYTIYLLV